MRLTASLLKQDPSTNLDETIQNIQNFRVHPLFKATANQ